MIEFKEWPKIPRLNRNCVITEKIDGTNASIYIPETPEEQAGLGDLPFLVGSRTRWITPQNDNYGFAQWAYKNQAELLKLGPGHHFGEWWGSGIQRGYGLKEKHFSLFNVGRWNRDNIPSCCSLVPVLYNGLYTEEAWRSTLVLLTKEGSKAALGFPRPEGIVIFHEASRQLYKVTLEKDEAPKGRDVS